MSEFTNQVETYLRELEAAYGGREGMLNELGHILQENTHYATANRRYRSLLAETAVVCGNLYEETGHEKLLDCERDLRKLIQYADSGTLPTQLELFAMPPEA